ncbi:hypothetical protein [Faunimonas pinastri]|nr:hypothetical protein [Faunimonas pinastri]
MPLLMSLQARVERRSRSGGLIPEWVFQQGARLAIALAAFAVIWCWLSG